MMTDRPQNRRRPVRAGEGFLLGLIVLCCSVEGVLLAADFGVLWRGNLRMLAYDYGAFWPGLLRDWAPNYAAQPALMFATYGFLHGGFVHLAFNMATLWSLGRVVLNGGGTWSFVFVYTVSLVVGAGVYGLLTESGQPMVGASGALFGLAGAIVAWMWQAQPTVEKSFAATWKILAFLTAFNVVMYFALSGGLAWETHLGGFMAGWAVAWWMDR